MKRMLKPSTPATLLSIILLSSLAYSQDTGGIEGVVMSQDGHPVHHARILLVQSGATTESDHDGKYRFEGVRPDTYDVFAEAATFTSQIALVKVTAGNVSRADLVLLLSPVRQSVTVTATGRHETTFEAVQSVNSLETFDIAEKMAPSIGEVLDGELGVAKRSFGSGNSRPVVRGFDGDRVLILSDGMRVGSLGSQSGDHGEPIDPGSLERLEVVKGPATLLYGSNAIGGVVNTISRHHEMHKHRHDGVRGQITSAVGSNNGLASANATVEYGSGSWMYWGGGGGQRTGDYSSPEGPIENSKSRIGNGNFGLGWFGDKAYLSGGYNFRDGRYGIPFANELHGHDEEPDEEQEVDAVDVKWRHHNMRVNGGARGLDSFIKNIRVGLNYTKWHHDELERLPGDVEVIGTAFDNKQFTYRADLDHAVSKMPPLSLRNSPMIASGSSSGEDSNISATAQRGRFKSNPTKR
jgi:iron complex outermembrane receptor protein